MHLEDPCLAAITAATRRAYDENAAQYAGRTDEFESFPGLEDEVERFRAVLPEGRVLDLGCGAGRDTRHLISRGRDVISGDLSIELLRLTRRWPNTRLVQLDLMSLPFRDGSFAGVWACGSLLHTPSAAHPRAFSEIYRVLAGCGATAISLRDGEGEGWRRGVRMDDERWFTLRRPDHVVQELASTGFTSIRWTHCGRGDWFIVEAVKPWVPTRQDAARTESA